MRLENNKFLMLQTIIDKEIMPCVTKKVNRKYNIGHITGVIHDISGIEITPPLLAQLLRQRGITEERDSRGVSHFAIDDIFFLGDDEL